MSLMEKRIKQILIERGVGFEEFEHEAVYTCEQAAKVRGLESAEEGIKSMIFKTDAGRFILVLNPGNQRIDTKKIAQMEKTKDLMLATPKEVERIAGVPIGCVAPFGLMRKLRTYLHSELLQKESLYFNPGSHTKTLRIKAKDLINVLEDPILFD
jgi:prolyl-tRNA editing enzyme YbaK/EbsC (Cys-tRNA(Pro) deacylase)